MGALIDKYFDHISDGTKVSKEEEIVFGILSDFTDRRGLRQEWEQIDDDIQEEMIETWIEIVKDKLSTQ